MRKRNAHYRIVEHSFNKFEPQIWRWWLPIWVSLNIKCEYMYEDSAVIAVTYPLICQARQVCIDHATYQNKCDFVPLSPVIHPVILGGTTKSCHPSSHLRSIKTWIP